MSNMASVNSFEEYYLTVEPIRGRPHNRPFYHQESSVIQDLIIDIDFTAACYKDKLMALDVKIG